MDSGVVVAIIGGAFTIVVAMVSLTPHVGRLRRLERVVAVIEKVEEGEHRDVLVGVRNRLIDGYKPKALSTFKFGLTTVILVIAATGSTAFQYTSGVTEPARAWLGLLTVLLFFASGVTGIIALLLAGRDLANDLAAIRVTLRLRKTERDAAVQGGPPVSHKIPADAAHPIR